MTKLVYLSRADTMVRKMFMNRGWIVCYQLEDADLVVFPGGADVSPELYGQAKHPYSVVCERDDKTDIAVYERAQHKGIACVGICRGGQFLNVMNGGSMYQHVNNHRGNHQAVTSTGWELEVTSTHHQMMIPDEDGVVLLKAGRSNRREYMGEEQETIADIGVHEDVESVYYPETNSLCFQPHPEYMDWKSDCQTLFFKYLSEHLGVI